jgi:hypothetical protein
MLSRLIFCPICPRKILRRSASLQLVIAVACCEQLRVPQLTPLIGRNEELERLVRRWRDLASGESRSVLIAGEPGIGKSRLLAALVERLQHEPCTRLRYFCSPYHQESPLYPIIAHLERAAGFTRRDMASHGS